MLIFDAFAQAIEDNTMRNTAETIGDVTFDNPFGSRSIGTENLTNGCDGAVLCSKSMRTFTKDGFIDGFQNECDA